MRIVEASVYILCDVVKSVFAANVHDWCVRLVSVSVERDVLCGEKSCVGSNNSQGEGEGGE